MLTITFLNYQTDRTDHHGPIPAVQCRYGEIIDHEGEEIAVRTIEDQWMFRGNLYTDFAISAVGKEDHEHRWIERPGGNGYLCADCGVHLATLAGQDDISEATDKHRDVVLARLRLLQRHLIQGRTFEEIDGLCEHINRFGPSL